MLVVRTALEWLVTLATVDRRVTALVVVAFAALAVARLDINLPYGSL